MENLNTSLYSHPIAVYKLNSDEKKLLSKLIVMCFYYHYAHFQKGIRLKWKLQLKQFLYFLQS